MIGGVIIEFGWCGLGAAGGLFPEARLGLVRICCYRGNLIQTFSRVAGALRLAVEQLRRARPATQAGRGPAFPPASNSAGDAKAPPASFAEGSQ